jgi:hypothetical protein
MHENNFLCWEEEKYFHILMTEIGREAFTVQKGKVNFIEE